MKVANYGTIFVTIADTDKEEALPLIRRFYNLGFNIEATRGTADFLQAPRHPHPLAHASSARAASEILDSLRQGHVNYVINTIDLDQHNTRFDGYEMRRAAWSSNNVTLFTSLETVKVLLDVLEEITLSVSTIDAKSFRLPCGTCGTSLVRSERDMRLVCPVRLGRARCTTSACLKSKFGSKSHVQESNLHASLQRTADACRMAHDARRRRAADHGARTVPSTSNSTGATCAARSRSATGTNGRSR